MDYLQVDAGADFVITQFFYDTEAFLRYVKRCREVGITCPIIPGIMAIQVRARRLFLFVCLSRPRPTAWPRS